MRRAVHSLLLLSFTLLLAAPASAQVRGDHEPPCLGEMWGRPVQRAPVPPAAAARPSAGDSNTPVGDGAALSPSAISVPLVLRRIDYAIDVVGSIASVDLEQEFVNDTDEVLEARYLFPTPPQAAVHAFRLEVGDRVFEGVVREKQRARQQFEQARREGRRASLLEQHRPNVFTSEVTNILPGDVVVVRIGFSMAVPFDDGWFRLRVPLTVAKRFRPAGTTSPAIPSPPRTTGEALKDRELVLSVHLDGAFPVAGVQSPTHRVRTRRSAKDTVVELARADEPANRDFVLEYALGSKAEARAMTAVSPDIDGWRDVLLLLTPPTAPVETTARPREVLFVLDTSGSMGGGSLDAAKAALSKCLRGLTTNDLFHVTEYDSDYTEFAPGPLLADDDTVQSALDWLKALKSDGGTNLLPALANALATPGSATHHRVVVVLTDGGIGNENDVFRLLEEKLGDARLFVVGIGAAPNAHLAKGMAERGRGTAEFLSPGQSIDEGVQRLMRRISSPIAWDLELDWGGADVLDVMPDPLPDLYGGRPVTVLARVRDASSLELRLQGNTPLGWESWELTVDPSAGTEREVVSKLWARERIGRLERKLEKLERSMGGEAEHDAVEEVREELVKHAVEHGLASSQTSFVVVEQEVVAPDGPDRRRDVPIEEPASWPRTATKRPRMLAVGVALLVFGLIVAVTEGRLPFVGRRRRQA